MNLCPTRSSRGRSATTECTSGWPDLSFHCRIPTSYPIEAFLKFSDGSNLKVVDEQLQPPLGTGRMFGPFSQVQGKSISQVNFKVGANKDPKATGFSYRISVQGCN